MEMELWTGAKEFNTIEAYECPSSYNLEQSTA